MVMDYGLPNDFVFSAIVLLLHLIFITGNTYFKVYYLVVLPDFYIVAIHAKIFKFKIAYIISKRDHIGFSDPSHLTL